jgi:hypothetical protein
VSTLASIPTAVNVRANPQLARLASWWPLVGLLAAFAAVVVVLGALGHPGDAPSGVGRWLQRVPRGLERVTGIPGWAAATVGTSLFGLLLAGIGFYNDVAWHIYLGRDKNLFTAPHTMIVAGLATITGAAGVGIVFASLDRVKTAIRGEWLRVPWSTVPLGVLGCTALAGFPLDDRWHSFYGIDVTMWSPTHLIMIMGAALSPLAAWLVLAEAGVRPSDSGWARVAHTLTAMLVLAGLTAPLGEFAFGVPQYSQLYQPALIALASGIALVAARLVLGPFGALIVAGSSLLFGVGTFVQPRPGAHLVAQRAPALYLAGALAVELAAVAFGTRRRVRFAIGSGVAIATLGLGGEWWWNARAHQPWHGPLALPALLISLLLAPAAAVVGAAYAGAIRSAPAIRSGAPTGEWAATGSTAGAVSGARAASGAAAGAGEAAPTVVPAFAVVAAFVAITLGLMIPLPRRVAPVTATVHLIPAASAGPLFGSEATVQVTLQPAGAADHAWWFQTGAWQGGGLVNAAMKETGPGQWTSEQPVPVGGGWKTLVRLHKGTTMMAVPVFFPADPGINAAEIPAVDRTAPFLNERHYLLREETGGASWYADMVEALIVGIVALWLGSYALAAARVSQRRSIPVSERPGPSGSGNTPSRRPQPASRPA